MKFHPTLIPGCVMIEQEPHRDERGFFARSYCPFEFQSAGIEFTPIQMNLSRNDSELTLRGLHFQDPPFAEAKLIRVARGRIFDAVVDLREQSPTFCQWFGVELDAEKGNQLFVPEGCAHGFLTLEPSTDVLYMMGRAYTPGKARGYRFDDPAFGIQWPGAAKVISAADLAWTAFQKQAI